MKRYVYEQHSDVVRGLLKHSPRATNRLAIAEIASALARRTREGSLSSRQRDRLIRSVQDDMAGFELIEVTPEIISSACALLCRHRLRTNDAVHIASALLLHERLTRPGFEPKTEFIGFDGDLNTAAQAEGLTTVNV